MEPALPVGAQPLVVSAREKGEGRPHRAGVGVGGTAVRGGDWRAAGCGQAHRPRRAGEGAGAGGDTRGTTEGRQRGGSLPQTLD